jgi:hypothetical protein
VYPGSRTPPGRSPKWRDPGSEDSCEFGFPVIEILAIENDRLHSIFLHVAYGSQAC